MENLNAKNEKKTDKFLKKIERKKEIEKKKNENKRFNSIYKELFELSNFFVNSNNYYNSNIRNCILYPNIFSYEKLMKKILSIFSLETDNDIFIYFINIFENSKDEFNGHLSTEIMNIFSLLLFFKDNDFLVNKNNDVKNKAIDLFQKNIIFNKNNSLENLKLYISFFDINDELKNYYSDKNNTKNYEGIILLKIIYIFSFQKLYSYEIFYLNENIEERNFEEEKEDKINKPEFKDYFIQLMYNTYLLDEDIFLSFNQFILKTINPNSILPHFIKMILETNKENKNLTEEIKNSLIIDLMEKPSLNDYYELLNYYNIIYENNYQINFSNIEKEINTFFGFLVTKIKAPIKSLKLIKFLDEKTRKTLPEKLIKQTLFNIDISDKENIQYLLKTFPKFINSYFQNNINKEKELLNIIRILPNINLPDNIQKQLDKKAEISFMNYKIREEDDHFDIIVDFALSNENTLNFTINKYLEKSNEKNENQKINYQKYLYLINIGVEKGILNKNNYDIKEKSEINLEEDFFGPHDENCIQYSRKEINVSFIDNLDILNSEYSKYFINSEYIGIDTEWKQNMKSQNKIEVSIIQMCDFEEKNMMIIDLIKLSKVKEFFTIFKKMFLNKKFIGFSFNKNDLSVLPDEISNVLSKCELIDVIDLYQYTFLKKCRSLKLTCEELLGKSLCKYEQCSNWEKRPLKESQLHYSALDSLVCVSLFKKLYK